MLGMDLSELTYPSAQGFRKTVRIKTRIPGNENLIARRI
jgi:hypothetical protein